MFESLLGFFEHYSLKGLATSDEAVLGDTEQVFCVGTPVTQLDQTGNRTAKSIVPYTGMINAERILVIWRGLSCRLTVNLF